MQGKRILAVIPARAGSKRLPGKNIKSLSGKPLIQWTIEAAQQCHSITTTLVSTDCNQTAQLAKSLNASVPFLRPAAIAGDQVTSVEVVLHALEYLQNNGEHFDYVILLQPTSPLRTFNDINRAINALTEKKANGIISVCECEHSPLWANTLDKNGAMKDFLSPFLTKNTRSQDLPPYYRLNGAIYIADVQCFLKEKNLFLKDKLFAHVMTSENSVDIDNAMDFKFAELLLNEKRSG